MGLAVGAVGGATGMVVTGLELAVVPIAAMAVALGAVEPVRMVEAEVEAGGLLEGAVEQETTAAVGFEAWGASALQVELGLELELAADIALEAKVEAVVLMAVVLATNSIKARRRRTNSSGE